MYSRLQLPWSSTPSRAEAAYRAAGLVKTQGTIYLLPPSIDALSDTFNVPPRSKTRMSSGACALCKHFERGGASSEHGRKHPYWPLPVGSNENKTRLASEALQRMLKTVAWKNVMMLHRGVAVYEIRNDQGYGMRWTLEVAEDRSNEDVEPKQSHHKSENQVESNSSEVRIRTEDPSKAHERGESEAERRWKIEKLTFRGFLEPIEEVELD